MFCCDYGFNIRNHQQQADSNLIAGVVPRVYPRQQATASNHVCLILGGISPEDALMGPPHSLKLHNYFCQRWFRWFLNMFVLVLLLI